MLSHNQGLEYTGIRIWASGTKHEGTAPYILMLRDDNNLSLYDNYGERIWCNKMMGKGHGKAYLRRHIITPLVVALVMVVSKPHVLPAKVPIIFCRIVALAKMVDI